MDELRANDWGVIVGLGAIWLGVQIVVVGRLPRAFRAGGRSSAPKGGPEAFGLFWIDQYGYIGLTLAVAGTGAALWGLLA